MQQSTIGTFAQIIQAMGTERSGMEFPNRDRDKRKAGAGLFFATGLRYL